MKLNGGGPKRKDKTTTVARPLRRLVGRMAMLEWGGDVHACLVVKIHIAELKFNPSNVVAEARRK